MGEFELFMKNPYWHGLYDSAPALVKKIYEIDWTYNSVETPKEKQEERLSIFKSFSDADWQFYISNCSNVQAKTYYSNLRQSFA